MRKNPTFKDTKRLFYEGLMYRTK